MWVCSVSFRPLRSYQLLWLQHFWVLSDLLIQVLQIHCSFRVSYSTTSRLLSGSLITQCWSLSLPWLYLSCTFNNWVLWYFVLWPGDEWSLPLFWIRPVCGCCGVSCCSIVFLSEPLLECLVWIWEVQPALTNTSIYVCFSKTIIFQGIETKQPPLHLPFNKPFL